MKRFPLAAAILAACGTAGAEDVRLETIDLYVDKATRQIFAEPGSGRQRLGRFDPVAEGTKPTTFAGSAVDGPQAPVSFANSDAPKPWYDRIGIRGYVQLRYNQEAGGDADRLKSPGDRYIGRDQDFGIRRARVVISGDVADHLSIYLQPDLASTPSGSSTGNFAQLRDAYADLWLDKGRTYRIRAGQSKIPYGWENLQSSQNRLAPDRADALNSGVRDERDLGVFFYWTPKVAKERFAYLQKSGLKGSGDYGAIGAGVYNGQGANRPDRNDRLHSVIHVSWPFRFGNGQYLEVGADAYSGRYKVGTGAATFGGVTFTPLVEGPSSGSTDRRVAAHIVYYPQPFGIQAEWTVGRGPELDVARRLVRTKPLRGGYAQVMYRLEGGYGSLMPYLKWQTYRGAAKFDTNAPRMAVDESEAGIEWQPSNAVELAVAWANMRRTDVSAAPYPRVKGQLLRMQLQVNY